MHSVLFADDMLYSTNELHNRRKQASLLVPGAVCWPVHWQITGRCFHDPKEACSGDQRVQTQELYLQLTVHEMSIMFPLCLHPGKST